MKLSIRLTPCKRKGLVKSLRSRSSRPKDLRDGKTMRQATSTRPSSKESPPAIKAPATVAQCRYATGRQLEKSLPHCPGSASPDTRALPNPASKPSPYRLLIPVYRHWP